MGEEEEEEEEGGVVFSLSDPSCKASITSPRIQIPISLSDEHTQDLNTKKVPGKWISSSSINYWIKEFHELSCFFFPGKFSTPIGSADTLEFWW